MKSLNTQLSTQPYMYIIQSHLHNLSAYTSRAEVEAAIVVTCTGRVTRNTMLALHLNNLELTYGFQALIDAASNLGFCTLDKAI